MIQGGVYAGVSTFISIVIVILLKSFVGIEFVSGPLTNVVAEFYAFFLSQSWIILLTFSFI